MNLGSLKSYKDTMKKLCTAFLCIFSLLLLTPITVYAGGDESNEFSPARYDGWGVDNCEEETVSWTTSVGLDRHKQNFENITGANPINDAAVIDTFEGGVVIIHIPDNLVINTESLTFSIPFFIADQMGYMTERYYDVDISLVFEEVATIGYSNIDDLIASMQDNQYGFFTDVNVVSGEEQRFLVVKFVDFQDGYTVSNYDDVLETLEIDYNLDPVTDAAQINHTRNANSSVGYGILINFDTLVVQPDSTVSILTTITENNHQSVTKEITVPYCQQGTLEIQNLDEQGQPLPNIEFFIEVLDEQTLQYVSYKINGQTVSVVTDENGFATISGLSKGSYRLVQSTPFGYGEPSYSTDEDFIIDDTATTYSVVVINGIQEINKIKVNWAIFYNLYGWIPDSGVSVSFSNNSGSTVFVQIGGNADELIWNEEFNPFSPLFNNPEALIRITDAEGSEYLFAKENYGDTLELTVFVLGWDPSVVLLWDDNDNEDGMRPDSLVVTLLLYGQPLITNTYIDDNYTWWWVAFETVAYYPDIDYTYSVDVDGYEAWIEPGMIVMTRVKDSDVPVPEDDAPVIPEVIPVADDTNPDSVTVLPNTGAEHETGIAMLCLGFVLVTFGFKKEGD